MRAGLAWRLRAKSKGYQPAALETKSHSFGWLVYDGARLKIDVLAALIRAQSRFLDRRTLIITGERAEESRARASYATFEAHRTDTRDSARRRRHVDHWRPVHHLAERDVWATMRNHGITPAPAYRLGWSRLSCMGCIFGGADQWSSLCAIAPAWFERIAAYEELFGCTIQRHCSIRALADRGIPFAAALAQPDLARRALTPEWTEPVRVPVSEWRLPASAFGRGGGPT